MQWNIIQLLREETKLEGKWVELESAVLSEVTQTQEEKIP